MLVVGFSFGNCRKFYIDVAGLFLNKFYLRDDFSWLTKIVYLYSNIS